MADDVVVPPTLNDWDAINTGTRSRQIGDWNRWGMKRVFD